MIAIAAESVSKRFRRQTIQPHITLGSCSSKSTLDDYVTATGESHSVEKLVEIAFTYLELSMACDRGPKATSAGRNSFTH
jgi:hypothetical protein